MAENKLVVLVEEPWEVVGHGHDHDHDHFGKSGDGTDHERALAELKSNFVRVLEKRETSPSSSSSKLHCTKVPESLLRSEEKGGGDDHGCYAPKLISLGPYHHGKSHLAMEEKLKLNLEKSYINKCGASVDEIYRSISFSINQLMGCYDAESTKKYKDGDFTVMMLVDGCALLCYILCVCSGHELEDFNIRDQDMSLLYQDVLLLENQLPNHLLLDLMKMVKMKSANYFWTAIFQEFFGINDESIFQKFMGMKSKESFVKKK